MYKLNAKGKTAELLIYDIVGDGIFGGITARQVMTDLKAAGNIESLSVRINSPGGDVHEGHAIYNAIKRHPARVIVDIDGVAASIASVIAMAGDTVRIADNAMMMIHKPWAFGMGTADEHRTIAGALDRAEAGILEAYQKKSGQTTKQLEAWLAAETWFDATEAVDAGLADELGDEQQLSACDFSKFAYKHIPQRLVERATPRRDAAAARLAAMRAVVDGYRPER